MSPRPLHFLRRGQPVTLHDIPPDRTLLEVLREDLHCTGTKEGCGEGDCGACTVVLGERTLDADGQPRLHYKAINSCIRLAHSVDGMALWTVEDLAQDPDIQLPAGQQLHPVQQALAQCHGTQCGFCTPGFVMSLFGMYQNHARGAALDRQGAQEALSGNLCRCTGYRPIMEAARDMAQLPPATVDAPAALQKLELLARKDAVIEAENSQQALHQLVCEPDIALLFTDVVMPGGMSGSELAHQARTLRPDLPVLFASGYTGHAMIHHGGLGAGALLLPKPYLRSQLADKLVQAFKSAATRDLGSSLP